jgi:hypothetical protein
MITKRVTFDKPPVSCFSGVVLMKVIFQRLGHVFYRAAGVIAGLLLFACPAAIFTVLGFAPMTNVAEAMAVGFVCIVMACLSWVAGQAIRYAIGGYRLPPSTGYTWPW